MLKKPLKLGLYHFEVFKPNGTPYPNSSVTYFCTNIDCTLFTQYPHSARLRINGLDIGALKDVFLWKK